jgi:hypothetical protein
MDKLDYLKELHNHLEKAARLMVSQKDFGQRLETLADIEHEVYLEIKEIYDELAPPLMPSDVEISSTQY